MSAFLCAKIRWRAPVCENTRHEQRHSRAPHITVLPHTARRSTSPSATFESLKRSTKTSTNNTSENESVARALSGGRFTQGAEIRHVGTHGVARSSARGVGSRSAPLETDEHCLSRKPSSARLHQAHPCRTRAIGRPSTCRGSGMHPLGKISDKALPRGGSPASGKRPKPHELTRSLGVTRVRLPRRPGPAPSWRARLGTRPRLGPRRFRMLPPGKRPRGRLPPCCGDPGE
jgi:hypothetical protein